MDKMSNSLSKDLNGLPFNFKTWSQALRDTLICDEHTFLQSSNELKEKKGIWNTVFAL